MPERLIIESAARVEAARRLILQSALTITAIRLITKATRERIRSSQVLLYREATRPDEPFEAFWRLRDASMVSCVTDGEAIPSKQAAREPAAA